MMNFWYTTSQSRRKNRTSIPGRKVLPVPQWALRCRRDFSPWRTMCWTTPHIQANEGDEEIGHEYAYLFWNMPDGMYRVDGKYGQYCIVMPKLEYVITIAQERNISKAAERTCWQCRFLLPVCLWNLPECAVFPLAAAKGEEGLSLFCAVFHPATEPVPHIL